MTPALILSQYAENLRHVIEAVADIPDTHAAEQPGGLRNHPAWTLTHVCVSNDFALQLLGRPTMTPEKWAAIARFGTQPVADRSAYPGMAELISTLRSLHDAVSAAVKDMPMSFYDEPAPERIRHIAPTMGHILTYLLACHEQVHLGQLQAWRRAAGLAK